MTNSLATVSGSTESQSNEETLITDNPQVVATVSERFGAQYEPRMRLAYRDIRKLAEKASNIVQAVVLQHSETLDKFVDSVDTMLERLRVHNEKFSDDELQRLIIRLPILMYRLSDLLETAAIESDIAKAVTKNLQAIHYLQSDAKTIPAKRAHAELLTAEQEDVVELTKHVYRKLKDKLEMADKLFDALRKVQTSRDGDKAVFGRENRGPIIPTRRA